MITVFGVITVDRTWGCSDGCGIPIQVGEQALVVELEATGMGEYPTKVSHVECFRRSCTVDAAKPWQSQQESYLEALRIDTSDMISEVGRRLRANYLLVCEYQRGRTRQTVLDVPSLRVL